MANIASNSNRGMAAGSRKRREPTFHVSEPARLLRISRKRASTDSRRATADTVAEAKSATLMLLVGVSDRAIAEC